MSDIDWTRLREWLDVQRATGHLGPGCGSAEFEGHFGTDWRYEATWRMKRGYRTGMVADYLRWCEENPK